MDATAILLIAAAILQFAAAFQIINERSHS